MIPLFGFLEKDTIGILIMAYPNNTATDLIEKLQQSAAIRVKPQPRMKLLYKNRMMAPTVTVEQMGCEALDHFFVVPGNKDYV